MPGFTNSFFYFLVLKSVLLWRSGLGASPAMCPSALAHASHTPACTHQQTHFPLWHGKTGSVLLGEDFWKQAYKISNVSWPYSQLSLEVPLVKCSIVAAWDSGRAVLVCHTDAEVHL